MSLKILADENLSGAVISSLKKWGFDVIVPEPGADDLEIAKFAKQEQRILITHDSDFANILRFPPKEYFGILRIKIEPAFNEMVIPALERIFNNFKRGKEFRGKLIIVGAASFRVLETE